MTQPLLDDVARVIDDHNRVVDVTRAVGLTSLALPEPALEYSYDDHVEVVTRAARSALAHAPIGRRRPEVMVIVTAEPDGLFSRETPCPPQPRERRRTTRRRRPCIAPN